MKIKNLILIFVIMVVCFSCDNTPKKTVENSYTIYNGQDYQYTIITIDSCEYIMFARRVFSLAHKGNCKYCAERARRLALEIKNNDSIVYEQFVVDSTQH